MPKEKKKKKRRDHTPGVQEIEAVKTVEEEPVKVKKKKKKAKNPEDEPIQPLLEQISAFALTEVEGASPINYQAESSRIPQETKFSNMIS